MGPKFRPSLDAERIEHWLLVGEVSIDPNKLVITPLPFSARPYSILVSCLFSAALRSSQLNKHLYGSVFGPHTNHADGNPMDCGSLSASEIKSCSRCTKDRTLSPFAPDLIPALSPLVLKKIRARLLIPLTDSRCHFLHAIWSKYLAPQIVNTKESLPIGVRSTDDSFGPQMAGPRGSCPSNS